MADDDYRWRNEEDYRNRDRYGSGRKPGQEHDYGRAMLNDMRRYARGEYDADQPRGDQRTHDWGSRRDRDDEHRGYENRGYENRGYENRGYGGEYRGEGYRRDDYGRDYGSRARTYGGSGGERDWWDRTSDEVSSWFGDEDAERRRRMDERRGDDMWGGGTHRGRGPRGYTRSDDRIRDDVNDRLTDDPYVDASEVDVTVTNCEVTLNGTVDSRMARRRAEDIVESVSGVRHVRNNLRVRQTTATMGGTGAGAQGMASLGSSPGGSTQTTGVVGGSNTPATSTTTHTDSTTRR